MTGRISTMMAAPVSAFSCLAPRLAAGEKPEADRVDIALARRGRALDAAPAAEPHEGDALAEWRSWAGALAPPPAEEIGAARRTPSAPLGALEVGRPRPRRGKGLLKGRRTRFQAKRRVGTLAAEPTVHRGEREMFARD